MCFQNAMESFRHIEGRTMCDSSPVLFNAHRFRKSWLLLALSICLTSCDATHGKPSYQPESPTIASHLVSEGVINRQTGQTEIIDFLRDRDRVLDLDPKGETRVTYDRVFLTALRHRGMKEKISSPSSKPEDIQDMIRSYKP